MFQKKIQAKLSANEYVELGSLCMSIPSDPKYNFTVNTSAKSNQPVFSLEPAQNSKRINSIDQWTSAFQIFVAVYTRALIRRAVKRAGPSKKV